MSASDYEEIDERDGVVCPRCMGDGSVECYCGGDLCACLNYGERDCPTCYGEGEVSPERETTYFERQRQMHAAMRAVMKEPGQ